jgi:hypothetical protein
VALLEDKERVSELPGMEKEMPRSAIQYPAVFDQHMQAALGQAFEEVDPCQEIALLICGQIAGHYAC